MEREKKRIAAALAAVQAYLAQETGRTIVVPAPAPASSMWSVAGRVDQMALRAALTTRSRR